MGCLNNGHARRMSASCEKSNRFIFGPCRLKHAAKFWQSANVLKVEAPGLTSSDSILCHSGKRTSTGKAKVVDIPVSQAYWRWTQNLAWEEEWKPKLDDASLFHVCLMFCLFHVLRQTGVFLLLHAWKTGQSILTWYIVSPLTERLPRLSYRFSCECHQPSYRYCLNSACASTTVSVCLCSAIYLARPLLLALVLTRFSPNRQFTS
jgi:hypothetical protein